MKRDNFKVPGPLRRDLVRCIVPAPKVKFSQCRSAGFVTNRRSSENPSHTTPPLLLTRPFRTSIPCFAPFPHSVSFLVAGESFTIVVVHNRLSTLLLEKIFAMTALYTLQGSHLLVCMCGLPARGKTYIAQKGTRGKV